MTTPTFKGTPDQQSLAGEIFQLMRWQGRFFSANSPIKQTLNNLADFLAQKDNRDRATIEQEIDAALRENEDVFIRQEIENDVLYTTSRIGSYQPHQKDTRHTFVQRFYEPETPLPTDDISVVVSMSRPALTTVEPVFISDYWQEQAEQVFTSARHTRPLHAHPSIHDEDEIPAILEEQHPSDTEADYDAEQHPTTPLYSEPPQAFVEQQRPHIDEVPALTEEEPAPMQPEVTPLAASEEKALPEDVAPIDTEEIEAAPAAEVAALHTESIEAPPIPLEDVAPEALLPDKEPPASHPDIIEAPPRMSEATTLTLPDGSKVDLGQPLEHVMAQHGEQLKHILAERLEEDPLRRIVHFGRSYFPESGLVNLGKNDLRRIRDYILEMREPLTDTAIITDIYYHNTRNTDYEGFRFSLNYRLSREKDFEFVGVEGANLWSTRGLSIASTKRVKTSEMGQMLAYLTEPAYDDSLSFQNGDTIQQKGNIDLLLTFFEWEYGILPLNASLAMLLPGPVLPDQRSAVLRIESPQHYTNFLVEVRYPTGNRGGWVQGFEDFFHEHLIAGALIMLERAEEPNVFTLTYEEAPATTDRLLTLDEKKNKFSFSDMSYSCMVDDEQVISQQRFGRAKNLKSLPMNDRRKSDMVLEHVFEIMGERLGSREEPSYRMTLDDLHTTYNLLRPISRSYLRSLLDDHEACSTDESAPDTYLYQPEPELAEPEEEETFEDEDDELMKKWGYRYEDE